MDNFDAPLRHPLKSALCSLLSSPPLLASPSLKYTLDRVPDPSSDRDCFPFAVRRAVSRVRVRGWTLRGARARAPQNRRGARRAYIFGPPSNLREATGEAREVGVLGAKIKRTAVGLFGVGMLW